METKDIFERMAPNYDTDDRVRVAGIIAGAMRGELGAAPAQRALEYGCGTGLVGLALLDAFQTMLFVDISPQMIAQVQQKLEQGHIPNASTLCADFCVALPPGIAAEYILLSQVLLHVPDAPLLLERLYTLLSPGGHLLLVDFDKNEAVVSDKVHNGFDQAELIHLCKRIGFATAHAHTFYHGQKLFMNQDASLFLLHAGK